MSIVQRAKNILLDPKATWPVIDAEAATVQSIFVPYVVTLAAISALAAFIGLALVGAGGFGVNVRVPIGAGIVNLVVGFVLGLAMVYVLALVVDALAPTFGGQKNHISALKVIAYGSTAGFLGGLFNLIPALSILGLLAALYSIYLIYTGLPVLMKTPPEKALSYTAVVVVCGIVAGILFAVVMGFLTPSPAGRLGSTDGDAAISIKTPKGEVKIDARGFEEMAKRMEEATRKMEEAEKKGDTVAAGQAAAAVIGAIAGGTQRTPVAAAELKALLPESVAGMKRESFEAQSGGALGITGSTAKATYRDGKRQLTLDITDTGGLAGLMALAGWANMTTDRETDREIEKIYKQGQRTVREQYAKDGSHGEFTVILANGVLVQAAGNGVAADAIKKAVEGVNLGKLEAIK